MIIWKKSCITDEKWQKVRALLRKRIFVEGRIENKIKIFSIDISFVE